MPEAAGVEKCPRCIDEDLLRRVGYLVCAGCDLIIPIRRVPATESQLSFDDEPEVA